MLSHIHIGVSEFDRALSFYEALMDELGYPLKFIDRARPWAGWKPAATERPLFLIGRPFDDRDPSPGNGQMVALTAKNRSQVDRAYRRAVECGGTDEGRPGLRPEYHAHFYGAYVRDPDGNKICVCCHEPAASR